MYPYDTKHPSIWQWPNTYSQEVHESLTSQSIKGKRDHFIVFITLLSFNWQRYTSDLNKAVPWRLTNLFVMIRNTENRKGIIMTMSLKTFVDVEKFWLLLANFLISLIYTSRCFLMSQSNEGEINFNECGT